MKKKTIITAALILALLLLVGGAIAYFTDKETVGNVFTVGKVDIKLEETAWDETKAENLVPGEAVKKNPTIVNIGTVDAYAFMVVEVPCAGDREVFKFDFQREWTGLDLGTCQDGLATRVYYYGTGGTLKKLTVGQTTEPLFSIAEMIYDLTPEEAEDISKTINVYGYGIQADGITNTTPSNVWTLFNNSGNSNSGS